MDIKEQPSSSRSYINDPFITSARRRVEWSSERKPENFKPRVEIPLQIAQDIVSVLNSRVRNPHTPMSNVSQRQFQFWPKDAVQIHTQMPQKNVTIEEMYERSNPAYRTFENSYASRPAKQIDTPTTNPTENTATVSHSFATSQVSARPLRETKSFQLTESSSPKNKDSTVFSSVVQNVRVSDFNVRPQTPQGKHQSSFSDHFSIMKSEITKERLKTELTTTILRNKSPEVPLTNLKVILPSKESSLSSSSISRLPLALKRTSTSVGVTPPVDFGAQKHTLLNEIGWLDSQIAALKTKLYTQDVVCSQAFLESTLKKQQEIEKECYLTGEAFNLLKQENDANKRRLEALHHRSLRVFDISASGNNEALIRENTLLRAKLNKATQELAGKNEQKIEAIKQQALSQLQNEAKFTKLKYLTDKKAIACDMKAYLALLEDKIANRPSIYNRPSQL